MSYYYSNPGGFGISKTVLPSVTSSICQSAGLNSGGIVRESATVSTTSTAVGPYIQQLGGGSGGGGESGGTGGSVILITITNPGFGYSRAPRISITGGGGSNASAICTLNGTQIDQVTITNPGSGYTSAPDVIVPPPSGEGEGYITAILQAVISTGSSSTNPSASFQQVADNDPKLILLK